MPAAAQNLQALPGALGAMRLAQVCNPSSWTCGSRLFMPHLPLASY